MRLTLAGNGLPGIPVLEALRKLAPCPQDLTMCGADCTEAEVPGPNGG